MKRDGFTPWPAEFAARYVSKGYWRGRTLGQWMWELADRHGDRVAIVDGDVSVSYRDLAERADAMADNLLDLGLHDGDNILVQLPNSWEFTALLLACQRVGVAPVLAPLAYRQHELAYLAELADVRAIVVPDQWQGFDHQQLAADLAHDLHKSCPVLVLGDDVRDLNVDVRSLLERWQDPTRLRSRLDAHPPDPGDIALFLLSGDTTGAPRIVPRTHQDYEYNARRSAEICDFDEDTVYLVTLPMGDGLPLGSPGVLGTLGRGGRVVMLRSPEPEVAFPVIERERVTVTALVPSVAERWVAAAASHDLSSLELVQVGGSVMDLALGATLQQVYGMGPLNWPDGRPLCPDDEIRIVDERGEQVPFGGTGELLTRGPCTLRGYFRAPEHNAGAFTPDGWFRTGDLVRWDPTGTVVVEGRVFGRATERAA